MTRTSSSLPVATPRLLRRLNAAQVLDVLRRGEAMRVTDLVTATGMSRPTVDAVADDLVRLGWLVEVGDVRQARGRPARRLAFRADAGYVAGVDIGEMKVRAAVADLRGDVVAERLLPFERSARGRVRLTLIRQLVRSTLKDAGVQRDDLLAACVGCTGGVDPNTGTILYTGAFPGMEPPIPLRKLMAGTLGEDVLVDNDCNLAVIAERWMGAAQDVDDAICVLASERMGAGIVVDGRLVRGHAGAAGEMPFLGAHEVRHGAEGIADLLRDYGGAPAEEVFAAAAAGDDGAAEAVAHAVADAGRAIATMTLVLNPELVVIGGGIAGAGEAVVGPLREIVERMSHVPPRLEASPLGARGPLLGAIRAALDRVEAQALDGLHAAAA
jgi:predicted NBD/HSP70 family sugar kinase